MANFNTYLPTLLQHEGGYQNHASDNGNYNSLGQNVGTNFGISAKFYEGVIGRPPSVSDMKNITQQKAGQLYKNHFWDKISGDSIINQSVAEIIFDHAVNAGVSRAGSLVQKILKNEFSKTITTDGVIGVNTVNAINSVNPKTLFELIKAARISYYLSIGGVFAAGWVTRVKTFVFEKKKKR